MSTGTSANYYADLPCGSLVVIAGIVSTGKTDRLIQCAKSLINQTDTAAATAAQLDRLWGDAAAAVYARPRANRRVAVFTYDRDADLPSRQARPTASAGVAARSDHLGERPNARYDERPTFLTSGAGRCIYATATADPRTILESVETSGATDVFIDDAQFFEQQTFVSALKAMLRTGVNVIAATLSSDYAGHPWGVSSALMAMAESVLFMWVRCSRAGCCCERASATFSLPSSLSQRSPGVVGCEAADDAEVRYAPLCRSCYQKAAGGV